MEEILKSLSLTPKQADLLATPTVWDGQSEYFGPEECRMVEDLFFGLEDKAREADSDLKISRDGDQVVISLLPFDVRQQEISRSFPAKWAA